MKREYSICFCKESHKFQFSSKVFIQVNRNILEYYTDWTNGKFYFVKIKCMRNGIEVITELKYTRYLFDLFYTTNSKVIKLNEGTSNLNYYEGIQKNGANLGTEFMGEFGKYT